MTENKIIRNYLPEIFYLQVFRKVPNAVTVNLTSKCNQHCIYCEIGKNIKSLRNDNLTIDDLKWIIDQMAISKIYKLALCGGEPFLFESIFDVVEYAGKNKIRCSITSNGMTIYKMTDDEFNVLLKNKTQINISIDSFQENIQTFTRGIPSALDNAIKSIQRLNEKRISATLLCAISKYNYYDLYNFLSTAYQKGIKQILFQPIIYYSNYPDRNAVGQKSQINVGIDKLDVLTDELHKIIKFEKTHEIKTNVYRILPWIAYYLKAATIENSEWFFNNILKKFYCRDIHAIIDISYDGGIQPCGLSLATITIHKNRHLGLLQLWSDATRSIKEDIDSGHFHSYCNGCCHHFSRNMIASIMKYPIKNRVALFNMLSIILLRIKTSLTKKIITYTK